MLTRCRIERFRGFEDLDLPGLGRVNLLVGRNDSGKTSVLEALALLAAGADARRSREIIASRPSALSGAARAIRDTQWRPLFRRMRVDQAIGIRGETTTGEIAQEITLRNEGPATVAPGDDGAALREGPTGGGALEFRCRRGGQETEGAIRLGSDTATLSSPDAPAPIPCAFLAAGAGDMERLAVELGDLRRKKRDGIVLDSLRKIAPALKGIEAGAASGRPMIWCDLDHPELLPLGVAGEGLLRAARMVVAMGEVELALFDGIENGVHYSALSGVWRALDLASREFGAQIVATTHSFECVRAAWEVLDADDLRVFRLQGEVADRPVVSYTPEALAGTMRNGFELR